MQPTVLVNAYNRPQALERLLASLHQAVYPTEGRVPLIISLDRADGEAARQVRRLAQAFEWPFGTKQVLLQPDHLGLVEHFYRCGNLSQEYGPLIYLEDDLYVSPMYYTFAVQALAAYAPDEGIAGICLFALWFNGYTHQPFYPLLDEADVFFLQVPYYLGQAFTPEQWQRFADWSRATLGSAPGLAGPGAGRAIRQDDRLHSLFTRFDAEDWFPLRTQYLVDTGRTYVFPRESQAIGFGDPGTHFARISRFLQAPLQRYKREYRLKPRAASLAAYDSFFEILPEQLARALALSGRAGALQGVKYAVDLYGTKSAANLSLNPQVEYVLTSRPARASLVTFGKHLWPLEANVIEGVPGQEIRLARKTDLVWGRLADLAILQSNQAYFSRQRGLGKRQWLQLAMLSALQRLGWKSGK